MTDLTDYDATGLAAAYRAGHLSPREAVAATFAAIARHDPALKAFCLLDEDRALAAAAASERRHWDGMALGPLDGVPFTVKDNMAWAGHPMRRGSVTTAATPVAENAPAVDRLLEAGAIPIGKTTLPEFGWKGLGDSPLYGLTRNPWDTRMTTGGSSAGAAAAAALGMAPLHLGSDGAGSIRIPASFCGVFGLKPSYGRVPAYPPSPFGIVSHIGPLTRTVRDAAAIMNAIARPDPRDITATVTPPPTFGAGLGAGLSGMRIAWSPRLGYVDDLDPEVERVTAEAARVFSALGAIVEEADPGFADPVEILAPLWTTGAWSVLRAIPEERRAEIDPGFVAQAEIGRTVSGADFVAAANARGALSLATARFHERYDLLLTPSVAITAFEAGHDTPPDGRFGRNWLSWTPYSYPFNLTLQPAASVPCGFSAAGLPIGLQIVGPMGRDDLVLRVAAVFEEARPFGRIAAPRMGT